MGSKKRKTPFVPRWKASTNTFEIAASRAAKLSHSTVISLASALERSCEGLTLPETSAISWLNLRQAVMFSRRVERMGVVRGLAPVIDAGFDALEAIRGRCSTSAAWNYCAPEAEEIAAIVEMCEMHAFQLGQISHREFELIFMQSQEDLKRLPQICLPEAPRATSD